MAFATFLCVSFAVLGPACAAMSYNNGNFTVLVSSVDNYPDENHDYVDWHFYLRRINRNERVVDGYYSIKKDVVSPRVEIETYFLTNNKFIRVDTNEDMKQLCEEGTGKAFVDKYFEGNSSWSENCVLSPGYMEVKGERKIDINKTAHEKYKKVFYGTFKFILNFYNKENVRVGKLSYVVVTVRKK